MIYDDVEITYCSGGFRMRTENQIQSKINELTLQRRSLESRLASLTENSPQQDNLQAQLTRVEDMVMMLEWVLNAPVGRYHA
jgi:iron-sulfur cluster repair protein YtfE (RIC family)